MCLAELGEGVARVARPIRVIDATSSLQERQESLSLWRVGHRAFEFAVLCRAMPMERSEVSSASRSPRSRGIINVTNHDYKICNFMVEIMNESAYRRAVC